MSIDANFETAQDSDFNIELTLKQPNGSVLNATGYTFEGKYATAYGVDAFGSFTIVETDLSIGVINLQLSASATALIPVKGRKQIYVYDLEQTDTLGKKAKIMRGNLVVFAQVSK